MKFKIKNKNAIFLILILISIIIMGIGYSAINSITGEIKGTATAEAQSGVFITDVELESYVDADINTSKINNYIGTTMNSTVVLSSTNSNSEIVYKVTVYNSGEQNETYLGTIYDEEAYDNLGIIFEVEGIALDDEIGPKETKEFTIKFKYKDGVIPDSNILNSYINFKFGTPNRLMFADYQAETYLNSGVARDKIEDIKFVYGEVPETGLIEVEGINSFFDASEKQNESIWGYYTDVDGNGMYELTFTSTEPIYANVNSQDLFYDLYNVKKITFENFSTKGTTNMFSMFSIGEENFYNNINMTIENIVGLEKFDTSQVTDMGGMFYCCANLTSIDLSSFNTSNVEHMDSMFYGCESLNTLDLSKFNTSKVTNMCFMFYYCLNLSTLNISNFDTSQVTDMSYMFYGCRSLTTLDVSNFVTSQVTNMDHMFYRCEILTTLELSNFDTSNVENMESMFEHCENIEEFVLTNFNTSNVKTMEEMFNNCDIATKINVSSFDTSNVTSMRKMFCSCYALETIDLSNFVTGNVETMEEMFGSCTSLTSIDVSIFDIRKVTNMRYMFQNCIELTSLDLSNFNTSKLTDTSYMFYDCENLKTIYVSKYNEETNIGWTTKNVTISDYMFTNCTSLVGGNGTTYDSVHQDKEYARIDKYGEPGYLTNKNPVENRLMFADYQAETYLNTGMARDKIEDIKFVYGEVPNSGVISQFDASEKQDNSIIGYYTDVDGNGMYELTFASTDTIYANVDSQDLFYDLYKVKKITFDNFSTKGTKDMSYMFSMGGMWDINNWDENVALKEIIGLEKFDTSIVTNMDYMFDSLTKITNLDLSSFDTSNVTTMQGMFAACKSLTDLNISKFNTSKVINMDTMFWNCNSLKQIDLSSFDTSNVQDMSGLFGGGLPMPLEKIIGLENFNTSQVKDMSLMFQYCLNLESLDLSNFDTSQVTTMERMFDSCEKLVDLDLSAFNTSNVTNMSGMFEYCYGLTNLDLSNFDTSQVIDMRYMFYDCTNLKHLNITNFNTKKVTTMEAMFSGCMSLMELDVTSFDTTNVTNMSELFCYCLELTNIDLSKFNTSNVTRMDYMFAGGNSSGNMKLKEIKGLENFDTSKVTLMYAMFWNCPELTQIDLSNFNTSKVTDMNRMFGGNDGEMKVETIYVSEYDEATDTGWTTKSVSNSANMFQNCTSLVGGNGTKFDSSHTDKEYARIDKYGEPGYLTNKNKNRLKISNSNDETYLGTGCLKNLIEKIEFIYGEVPNSGVVLEFDASEKQDGSIMGYYTNKDGNGFYELTFCSKEAIYTNIDSSYLFSNLTSLKELKLDNFHTNGTTNMSFMFHNCTSLAELNLGNNFVTDDVTHMTCMFGAENNTSKMIYTEIIGLEKFNTSKVVEMQAMFWNNKNIKDLDLTNFNTSNVTKMTGMFSGCNALVNLNISSFDTSNVTDMRTMFDWCESLVNLDLSNFNTSRVTNMDGMFDTCTNLKTINLSSFDTSNVTNMSNMFKDCKSITTLNLNNIKTNSVTDMTSMFYNCTHLTSLDLSSFDTNNVTSMNSMFLGCIQLKEIKFGSNFNTKNVTDMFMMFQRCGINTLDLSTFNTSKVNDMRYMFYNCSTLTTIYVSEYNETTDTGWTTKSVTNSTNMFNFCRDLVGGIGTTYNSSILDATYARIDKAGEPGYFTNIKNK